MTVSKREPISAASMPSATAAFRSRAPSRWKPEVELERERVQLADLVERPDPPAARVVGVLDPEQAGPRRVDRGDAVGSAGLLGAVAAGHAGEPARDDAGVDGRAAELGDEDVAVLLADQLVAELGVEADRDLVRHRRGRQEDRLVLAEQVRGALLELVDRRVLAPLLVADGRGRDRRAHPRRRPGGGVRAEVDHGRQPIDFAFHNRSAIYMIMDALAALADPDPPPHRRAARGARARRRGAERALRRSASLRSHGICACSASTGSSARGRTPQRRVYSLDPAPLAALDDWLGRYRSFWAQRLDALETELRRTRRETT